MKKKNVSFKCMQSAVSVKIFKYVGRLANTLVLSQVLNHILFDVR